MTKLTQGEIKGLADKWAEVNAKIAKAETAKNAEIDPFLVRFNEDTEPIRVKHDKKINSLREQADEIEGQVLGWLNGVGKPIALAGEKAVAAVEAKIGNRVINVQKFFDSVKDKNVAFWECVSVAIAKAEKLVGKDKVDAVSSKESKLVATLKLK